MPFFRIDHFSARKQKQYKSEIVFSLHLTCPKTVSRETLVCGKGGENGQAFLIRAEKILGCAEVKKIFVGTHHDVRISLSVSERD